MCILLKPNSRKINNMLLMPKQQRWSRFHDQIMCWREQNVFSTDFRPHNQNQLTRCKTNRTWLWFFLCWIYNHMRSSRSSQMRRRKMVREEDYFGIFEYFILANLQKWEISLQVIFSLSDVFLSDKIYIIHFDALSMCVLRHQTLLVYTHNKTRQYDDHLVGNKVVVEDGDWTTKFFTRNRLFCLGSIKLNNVETNIFGMFFSLFSTSTSFLRR